MSDLSDKMANYGVMVGQIACQSSFLQWLNFFVSAQVVAMVTLGLWCNISMQKGQLSVVIREAMY